MTDNTDDEIIIVHIPRKDYKILREMIERERRYSWLKNYLRSIWVWAFTGGVMTLFAFGDRLAQFIQGVK